MALKAPSSSGIMWLILWFQDDMPLNTAGLPIQKALRVVKVHLWGPLLLNPGAPSEMHLVISMERTRFSVHNFLVYFTCPLIFLPALLSNFCFQYSIYVSRARKTGMLSPRGTPQRVCVRKVGWVFVHSGTQSSSWTDCSSPLVVYELFKCM